MTIVSGADRIAELEEETRMLRVQAEAYGRAAIANGLRADRLKEENAKLRADNLSLVNDLEKEGHRVTSLRLELETVKVENRRLLAKRAEDDYHWKGEVRSRQTEIQSLRIDLAAAIKTGEEQAEKIKELRSANEHAQRVIFEQNKRFRSQMEKHHMPPGEPA